MVNVLDQRMENVSNKRQTVPERFFVGGLQMRTSCLHEKKNSTRRLPGTVTPPSILVVV